MENNNVSQNDKCVFQSIHGICNLINVNKKSNRFKFRDFIYTSLHKYNNNNIDINHMVNAVMTRSMTRKQKMNKIDIDNDSSDNSDSDDNDDYKFVKIDAAVDNLYQRRQLRQRLLNTIFKKKRFDKIFNFDSWPDYKNQMKNCD